jgi:RND family efflux transporter MFP subunit
MLKAMNRGKNKAAGFALAPLAMALLLAGCGQGQEAATIPPVVEAKSPSVGSISLNRSFAGRVEEGRDVYVVPFASGEVKRVYRSEGDTVSSGDTLFVIDSSAAELQLKSAQAARNSAKAQADMSTGSSMEMQLISIEAQAEQARIGLESANSALQSARDKKREAQASTDSLKSAAEGLAAQAAALAQEIQALESQASSLPNAYQPSGAEGAGFQPAVSSPSLEAQLAEKKAALAQANERLAQAQSALAQSEAALAQADSAISQLETAQKQAQAGRDSAQKSLDLAREGLSSQTMSAASAGLAQADAAVDAARLQLSFYTVKSPVDGVVSRAMVKAHDMAAQGSPAYVINSSGATLVSFGASLESFSGLSRGMECSVSFQGKEYSGTLSELAASADPQTGLFKATAAVADPKGELVNGMAARVDVAVPQTQNSLNVPIDSVYFEGESAYVYRLVDGVASKTPVTVGRSGDSEIEIATGLTAKDKVITTWSAKLRDGSEVNVAPAPGESK